jgi:quercetin dioxygenase-like cupin family protein
MKVTNLEQTEKTKMTMEGAKDVFKQIPVAKSDGSPSFSVRVFTIMPGGHTPYHTHPFEHLNYIIEGQGVVVTASGEEVPVKKGDFALVLPEEKHQYKNMSSDQELIVICAVPKEYE